MTRPDDASLLDVLVDAFEKNEMLGGFHWRTLPLADEASAISKLESLAQEAARWKGTPTRDVREPGRRLVSWPDLEIRQAGRGVMVRARAPRFDWWNDAKTWAANPMGPLYDWLEEEREKP